MTFYAPTTKYLQSNNTIYIISYLRPTYISYSVFYIYRIFPDLSYKIFTDKILQPWWMFSLVQKNSSTRRLAITYFSTCQYQYSNPESTSSSCRLMITGSNLLQIFNAVHVCWIYRISISSRVLFGL